MAVITAGTLIAGAAISGAAQIIGGIFGMGAAKRKEREAAREKQRLQAKLTSLENSRQEIINPYEGVTDLSGMITNPYASLGVATQAAEIQIEQADISLANTLDTIRATGASAGGATALAQAALQSKQGVSASIAQQEAQNEKLRAQGQQQLERALFDAEAKGKQFVFGAQEKREMQKLNRLSSMAGAASQQAAAAESAQLQGIGQMVGGIGSFVAGGIGGGEGGKFGYSQRFKTD